MLVLFAALAVLTVANLAMTLALAQRLRGLQETVAQGAMRDPSLPRPGDRVGAFVARTLAGETVTEAEFAGGTALVGFFAPGCSTCTLVRSQLIERPPSIPMFAFVDESDNEAAAHDVARSLARVAQVALTRVGDPVTLAFREAGVPTLIRVERGSVVASGHRLADVMP
jgi:hypothetical protein